MRNDEYKPAVAGLALLGLAGVFLLVYAGAFTTSIEAGMVFKDWPLSNGSLNPEGWTQNIAMLAEHSHRLLGMFVGLVTIALTVLVWMKESRAWVRILSAVALAMVIIQGVLGGMRVLENSQMLALVHGIFAQITVCTLVAVALASSRLWHDFTPAPASERQVRKLRGFGIGLVASIVLQLILGATVRHTNAGLAMPTFPLPLLPDVWNHATGVHFLHRFLALLIFIKVILFTKKALQQGPENKGFRMLVSATLLLLFVQIALGAMSIWTLLQPLVTTLHVVNGAVLLAVTWAAVFLLFNSKNVVVESREAPMGRPIAEASR